MFYNIPVEHLLDFAIKKCIFDVKKAKLNLLV